MESDNDVKHDIECEIVHENVNVTHSAIYYLHIELFWNSSENISTCN